MEADFSGYATKAGLKCTDGRTIMPNAFQHQDKMQVPLVWQHGHKSPENVLGHAILENREDGVYAYGFFNDTPMANHAKQLLIHKDINMLSIWANELVERSGRVLHGAIREVSLVLSGANPGALIENVTIRHSDGDELLEDEAIIYTGLELEILEPEEELVHADGGTTTSTSDETVQDIYDSMTEKQKQVLHFMIGAALEEASGKSGNLSQSNLDGDVQGIYDSMNEQQKQVLHFMVGAALEEAEANLSQSNLDETPTNGNDQEGNEMSRNVFEKDATPDTGHVLSHADMEGIVADAMKIGSLKQAVQDYALAHGIYDIETLFPEATAMTAAPEFITRRMEWVSGVLSGARKTPFSRIKTHTADLTFEEARAKGYIKGDLKKEQFFGTSRRVTTPQTIYKKQKLDRDDIIDITDFDVVAWMKSEMRVMLDEELARAILIGDGRDPGAEDKINETNIRPIAKDDEFYTINVNVNVLDNDSSVQEIIDAIVLNRQFLRGTGQPTMYTTETVIAQFLLLKDTLGRRIYQSLDQLAAELRVAAIVPVEVLSDEPDILCILVNMSDYVVGADKGGQVSLFDDFDIDYNQYKYLIETRVSGALIRPKSAMVVKRTAQAAVLIPAPGTPTFDNDTGVVTLPTSTDFQWKDGDGGNLSDGAQAALDVGESLTVEAVADSGKFFATSENTSWTFTRR